MKRGALICLLAILVASSAALADDTPTTESAVLTESTAPTGSAEQAESTEPAPAHQPESAVRTESGDHIAGNVQFLVGQTYLHDFWRPLDEPMSFGAEVDFAPRKSPVRAALAMNVSGETEHVSAPYFGEEGRVGAGFLEFSAGFLFLPVRHAVARPYLGAGVLNLFAGVGGSDHWNGHTDHSFGFYGNAGIFFKVGSSFNIGIDGRLVRGTNITLAGRDGDADYGRVSLLMGFSWGE